MAYDILTPTGAPPTGTEITKLRSTTVGADEIPSVSLTHPSTGVALLGQASEAASIPVALSNEDAAAQASILAALLALPLDGLTDAELRASPVPVSGPLTDAQLRASPVPISGALTDAQIRATPIPVSGGLTNTELRATPVPVALNRPESERDFFGRLRFSEPAVVFASSPGFGINDLSWQTLTSGAGNGIAWSEPYRAAIITLAEAGYVVRQSYRYIPYELGRPVRVLLTGNADGVVANVTREWGQFDARNGVFWRRNPDGTMAVVVRSSTSGSPVDTAIQQASWNGTAVTFDPGLQQVWIIEYVWLGAFAVRWGLATANGIAYVHTQVFADEIPYSYMQTANLPIRWAAYAASTPPSPATLHIVCSAIESEGGYNLPPAFTFAGRRTIAAAIAAATAPTEAPIVALRPALTFSTIPNRIQALVQEIEVYSTASADWSLWYFPPGTADPLTGGSWAVPNAASSVEVNAAATAVTLTNGYRIAAGIAVSSGTGGSARGAVASAIQQTLPLTIDVCGANNPLTSNVGANPAYLVLAASGTGNVAGAINWKENR
jgi:hypothetical protein